MEAGFGVRRFWKSLFGVEFRLVVGERWILEYVRFYTFFFSVCGGREYFFFVFFR